MTSLLGRLLRLFPESVPLEDLFTEAVARLFETRPQLCLAWLEAAGLLTAPVADTGQSYMRVSTQRSFVALDHHDTDSRPDLMIEVYRSPEESVEGGEVTDVVMIESKIGSKEGPEQLRRYAEHLDRMTTSGSKTLVYITRGYDPKNSSEILSGLSENIGFEELRWHDFYRFLQSVEKDALIEEVMTFMEEQGMARSYRLSTTDLMALSVVPRAFEIFDETLGGEAIAALESFAGSRIKRETRGQLWSVRFHLRYGIRAPLHGEDLFCDVGFQLGKVDKSTGAAILQISAEGYPSIYAFLEARPGAVGRENSVAAMKRIALNQEWEPYNLDDPSGWAGVRRVRGFASLLPEEDHVAAVKHFFIESIYQLRDELTAFKKEHPDLLWNGGRP